MKDKEYRVKTLDFSFQQEYSVLGFRYLFYDVKAKHKDEAIKKARNLYMRGHKGSFSQELPILLKIFTVDGE